MSETRIEPPPRLEDVVACAWEAYHAADWDESFARWERVHALFPDYVPPFVHAGVSLREAGRLDAALAKLSHGLRRFPGEVELVTAYGLCLERMGRTTEADAWFTSQAPLFPDHPVVAIEYLCILQRRRDHAGILDAAALMERLHPQRLASDEGVRSIIADARLQAELARLDQPFATRQAPARPPADISNDKSLMLAFHSLGENCEFGLAQRHFGAEPLGLLRWAAISIENLTLALDEGFAGVGSREETLFFTGNDEYATGHARYGIGSHTFIKIDHGNEAAIQDRLLTRLSYLRRELLADLQDGIKTFVYTCEAGATDAEIAALHRALCRHGSRHLLFVRKSDADNPPASLRDGGGGLMLGYVERLGPDRRTDGDCWNIAFDQWACLLRACAARTGLLDRKA